MNPRTKNRFAEFYEGCASNPKAMREEMDWIHGATPPTEPLSRVGDIGRADSGDDLPFLDPKTADYSPRKQLLKVGPNEWHWTSAPPPTRADRILGLALLVLSAAAAIAGLLRVAGVVG